MFLSSERAEMAGDELMSPSEPNDGTPAVMEPEGEAQGTIDGESAQEAESGAAPEVTHRVMG